MNTYLSNSDIQQCELSLCRRWQIRPSLVNADWLRTRAIKAQKLADHIGESQEDK